MPVRHKRSSFRQPAAALALALVCASAGAQLIAPTRQARSVSSAAHATACGGAADPGFAEAPDFLPFDELVESLHVCEGSLAEAAAAQSSQISAARLSASGAAFARARQTALSTASAAARSSFSVSFELTEPARFHLTGTLTAAGALLGSDGAGATGFSATLRLARANLQSVVSARSDPAADGLRVTRPIDAIGVLDPGRYTLISDAQAGIDNEFAGLILGDTSFDLVLTIAPVCPGDVDGDAAVDLEDLAVLLSEFGMTGPDLASDLDHDLDVDLADLGVLLANFGSPCE